ncbi:MAG: putative porin [Bacteroidota bacterium]
MVFFLMAGALSAQRTTLPSGVNPQSSNRQSQAQGEPTGPDTLDVAYYYMDNPGQEYAFRDTLLGLFQQYDPIRQQKGVDDAHTGNLGSPMRPLFYRSRFQKGMDIGFHQFDGYQLHYSRLPFYRLKKAFTNAYYSQGPTQEDAYFKIQFGRDFAKGLSFSLIYDRINNAGVYKSQQTKHTALGMGFRYRSPRGKYQSFLVFTSNINRQIDNGGIQIDALTDQNSDQEFTIPVFLEDVAQTRYDVQEYAYTQYYNLTGKPDSVSEQSERRAFTIKHDLSYARGFYKYADTNPASDSIYYGPLQVDSRGLRHFLSKRVLSNRFSLQTSKLRSGAASNIRNQKDLLDFGLSHQIHFLEQEPQDTTINNLFIDGRWNFAPSERLKIQTYAHLGLLDNRGDYRVEAELFFDFKKAGSVQIEGLHQNYSPSLLQHRTYISKRRMWNNDFNRRFETSLSFTYRQPLTKTSINAQIHLLDNHIYYDTSGFAQQVGGIINVLQLGVGQEIHWRAFHLESWAGLQQISGSILRFPSIYTKHSFYLEGKLFRQVLRTRLGVDFRWSSAYRGVTYQPLIGQFHLDDSQDVGGYPALDLFISFKVSYFRAFVKSENIIEIFNPGFYYQVAGYPQPFNALRFGISWVFID